MGEKDQKTDVDATDEPKKLPRWRRIRWRNWIGVVLVASVVVHSGLFALGSLRNAKTARVTPEVSLGSFSFFDHKQQPGSTVAEVDFDLHIRLLSVVDRMGRKRLVDRKHKIQQDVEELLRRANGADFDDPSLTELKRQLQEKINEAMEMRVIEEVIITNLALRMRSDLKEAEQSKRPAAETVGTSAKPESTFIPREAPG